MILTMLSTLLWTSSLMASCFSSFTVKDSKDFCVMTVARERRRLVLLKAMLTGRPKPLANAAIEIPPAITVDLIRPVSTMPVIVLNRFGFFGNPFSNMFVVLVVPKVLNLDKFCLLFHCRIYSFFI